LRTVTATRYVTPLREGGSLPGLVEADDDGLYVLKFRGAGQGAKALVAEVVAGELARAIGLPVPELVLVELDPALGRAEPDPEIQELIEGSGGLNLGVDFLPGALPFDAQADLGADLAADVVWFDALVTNVDRTPRNPNLLCWHRRPLRLLGPSVAVGLVVSHLDAIPFVCAGGVGAGDIGRLAQRARFHWQVAPRSTVIQASAVHAGVHHDLAAALEALDPSADFDELDGHLAMLARVAAGDPDAGAVARLDQSERFHWLAAPSSTVIQPSPVHTGLTDDPARTLDKLFADLVS